MILRIMRKKQKKNIGCMREEDINKNTSSKTRIII
jgi:hypothetical protein